MPRVHFVKEDVTVDVAEGANLRKAAIRAGVNLYKTPSFVNCRGLGSCGRCYVVFKKDTAENASRMGWRERLRLLMSPLHPGRHDVGRLACQVEVMGDLEVETRPDLNLFGEFK